MPDLKSIQTPQELATLSDQVGSAKAEKDGPGTQQAINRAFEALKQRSGFIKRSLISDYEKTDIAVEHYQKIYSRLPESIKLSPEIAFILASDQQQYNAAQQAAIKQAKPIARMADMFINVAALLILFPNPQAAAGVVAKWAGFVKSGKDYREQMEEFDAKRSQIVVEILSTYKLAEPTSGHYELRRGKWINYCLQDPGPLALNQYFPQLSDTGLDKKLNFSALQQKIRDKMGKAGHGAP